MQSRRARERGRERRGDVRGDVAGAAVAFGARTVALSREPLKAGLQVLHLPTIDGLALGRQGLGLKLCLVLEVEVVRKPKPTGYVWLFPRFNDKYQ